MMGTSLLALVLCLFLKETLTKEALLQPTRMARRWLEWLEHPFPGCSDT